MHAAAPEHDGLRRLAGIRLDRPVILSLYLDLDPSQFATPSGPGHGRPLGA